MNRIKKLLQKSKDYIQENTLQAVWLFSILFRLLILLFVFNDVIIFNDSGSYIEPAEILLSGNIEEYDGTRSFGYPVLIALMNLNLNFVVYLQLVLGVFTSVITYKTMLNFDFSKLSSFYIIVVIHLVSSMFFYESSILMETLLLFLFSLVFYILSKNYFESHSIKQHSLLIVILCLLLITKSFYVYLPFLILFLAIIKTKFKFLMSKISLIFFPTLVFVLWCSFVKMNTGYFVSSSMFGIYKIQNCVHFAEKGPKEYQWLIEPYVKHREKLLKEEGYAAMAIWKALETGEFDSQKKDFFQLNEEFEKFAVKTIAQNPEDYIYQVVTKSWLDFWKVEINLDYSKFKFKSDHIFVKSIWLIKRVPKFTLGIFKFIFIPLFFFFSYQYIKNKKYFVPFAFSFLVFMSSIVQALATYGTNERYSFPFELIILIIVFQSYFIIKNRKLNT